VIWESEWVKSSRPFQLKFFFIGVFTRLINNNNTAKNVVKNNTIRNRSFVVIGLIYSKNIIEIIGWSKVIGKDRIWLLFEVVTSIRCLNHIVVAKAKINMTLNRIGKKGINKNFNIATIAPAIKSVINAKRNDRRI